MDTYNAVLPYGKSFDTSRMFVVLDLMKSPRWALPGNDASSHIRIRVGAHRSRNAQELQGFMRLLIHGPLTNYGQDQARIEEMFANNRNEYISERNRLRQLPQGVSKRVLITPYEAITN